MSPPNLKTVPKHGEPNALREQRYTADDVYELIVERLIPKIEGADSNANSAKAIAGRVETKVDRIEKAFETNRLQQEIFRTTIQGHGTALGNHSATIDKMKDEIVKAIGNAGLARVESRKALDSITEDDEITRQTARLALREREQELDERKRASDAKWALVGKAMPFVVVLLAMIAAYLRSKGL